VISFICFQTILPLQSALVVGNNLILLILYSPTANQTQFRRIKINFGICKSTFPPGSSNFENVLFNPTIDLMGFIIDIPVTDMDHIFRLLPDMYIMNEFIIKDLPGDVARLIAAAVFFLIIAAARCFSLGVISEPAAAPEGEADPLSDLRCSFSSAATRFIPRGRGKFWRSAYPSSDSLRVMSTDQLL
jgi:hypothetical protein